MKNIDFFFSQLIENEKGEEKLTWLDLVDKLLVNYFWKE